ncbi:MAG: hypothetical protein LBI27_01000 [Clostridiales bacterium]|jgi:hypothetical protein|nr:hypothetical protein [Clostridiales bacterium]
MRKTIFIIAALVLALALITACGNGNTTNPTPAPPVADVTPVDPPVAPDEPVAPDAPVVPDEPEIVSVFPAGMVYSLALDLHVQAAEVGLSGDNTLVDGTPFIMQAGNPRWWTIDGPNGTVALQFTNRDEAYFTIDLVTTQFDWDLASNQYLLTVRGYVDAATRMVINGGDNPWEELAGVDSEQGDYVLTLLIDAEVIAASGSRSHLRIQTVDAGIDFTIEEITVVQYIERPANLVYSLSTDPLFQALEVGTMGDDGDAHDVVLATPNLMSAGSPRFIVTETADGHNGLEIRNRQHDYFAVDLVTDAIAWDFDNNNYVITVTGNVGEGGMFIIGGADSPWERFATVDPDDDKNFTVSHVLQSQDDLAAAGSRRNFRFMEEGQEHLVIYDIRVEIQ